jgi:hypothetical protein
MPREKVLAKVGPQLAADLYPSSSWRDHPPTAASPDFETEPQEPPSEEGETTKAPARRRHRAALESLLPEWLLAQVDGFDDPLLVPGSNNWVFSGVHTTTGKPLLSNDMHLGHQVPSVWYESQLTALGYDVAGVTFAGMPFIVVGHNQRIGWGFTNVGPDVQDLYIEKINPDNPNQYEVDGAWKDMTLVQETIQVAGGDPVPLTVRYTRHGPIISETYGMLKDEDAYFLRGVIRHLELQGYLEQTGAEYPVLRLTPKSRAVLLGNERLTMKRAKEPPRKPEKRKSGASLPVAAPDEDLLHELRQLRRKLAQEAGVPAYVVFSDATLLDMCRRKPHSAAEFLGVSGVGQVKLERYGKAFLDVLRAHPG